LGRVHGSGGSRAEEKDPDLAGFFSELGATASSALNPVELAQWIQERSQKTSADVTDVIDSVYLVPVSKENPYLYTLVSHQEHAKNKHYLTLREAQTLTELEAGNRKKISEMFHYFTLLLSITLRSLFAYFKSIDLTEIFGFHATFFLFSSDDP
jgi:hypothetical protein